MKNPASAHFQGNPKKWIWKFFFWLGGAKYYARFSYFRNSWIFGANGLIFSDGGSSPEEGEITVRANKRGIWSINYSLMTSSMRGR